METMGCYKQLSLKIEIFKQRTMYYQQINITCIDRIKDPTCGVFRGGLSEGRTAAFHHVDD